MQSEFSWSPYGSADEEVNLGETFRFFDLLPFRILDKLIKNTGFKLVLNWFEADARHIRCQKVHAMQACCTR